MQNNSLSGLLVGLFSLVLLNNLCKYKARQILKLSWPNSELCYYLPIIFLPGNQTDYLSQFESDFIGFTYVEDIED